MKVEFERIITPNYIRTKQGIFHISELSYNEICEYLEIYCDLVVDKYYKKQSKKENED